MADHDVDSVAEENLCIANGLFRKFSLKLRSGVPMARQIDAENLKSRVCESRG
jgi:hypothetical protein